MGNGRGWLSGKASGKISGSSLQRVCVMGAALVLLSAACVMLKSGSRRYDQKAANPSSPIPIPTAFGKTPLKSKTDARAILSKLPLIFEPNQGQADSRVKFVSHGGGYGLYLDSTGATLAMRASSDAGRACPSMSERSIATREGRAMPIPSRRDGTKCGIRAHDTGGCQPCGSGRRERATSW